MAISGRNALNSTTNKQTNRPQVSLGSRPGLDRPTQPDECSRLPRHPSAPPSQASALGACRLYPSLGASALGACRSCPSLGAGGPARARAILIGLSAGGVSLLV